MEEPQSLRDEDATLVVNGEEATLIAPRFDDEETLVARPVVPLEEGVQETAYDATHDVRPAASNAPRYTRPYGPRRTWMLALMLASVLIGGVLGGAGLYLYQRQTQDSGEAARPATSAEAAAAPNAPAVETRSAPQQPATAPTVQPETPAASEPRPEEPAAPAAAPDDNAAAPAHEHESVPAAERRDVPREGGISAAPKRGKKGERDEEIERRPARRAEGNVARAESDDDGPPQARRVDTIFYRQRRAARRARRDDDTDRLRRIFEGTPER
jgi:type IV secretory pathway VirB10-like protein